jgi:protein SCO1/2
MSLRSKLRQKWILFFFLAGLTSVTAKGTEPSLTPAKLNPIFNDVRFDQHLGEKLPLEAIVTDEYGQRRTLGSLFNHRPVVLVFSYYRCPNLCTLVLDGLVDGVKPLLRQIGPTFDILTLSIDPEERPSLALAKKRTYLARLGKSQINEKETIPFAWHFLTADSENIKRLTRAGGFYYRRDEKSGEYLHPSGLLIATPNGIISQYFFGIQFDSLKLRSAIAAAGSGRQGSLVDRILLFCFHYDPAASVHGPLIIKSIRIAAVTGAALLFGLLVSLIMSNPERRAA